MSKTIVTVINNFSKLLYNSLTLCKKLKLLSIWTIVFEKKIRNLKAFVFLSNNKCFSYILFTFILFYFWSYKKYQPGNFFSIKQGKLRRKKKTRRRGRSNHLYKSKRYFDVSSTEWDYSPSSNWFIFYHTALWLLKMGEQHPYLNVKSRKRLRRSKKKKMQKRKRINPAKMRKK